MHGLVIFWRNKVVSHRIDNIGPEAFVEKARYWVLKNKLAPYYVLGTVHFQFTGRVATWGDHGS